METEASKASVLQLGPTGLCSLCPVALPRASPLSPHLWGRFYLFLAQLKTLSGTLGSRGSPESRGLQGLWDWAPLTFPRHQGSKPLSEDCPPCTLTLATGSTE